MKKIVVGFWSILFLGLLSQCNKDRITYTCFDVESAVNTNSGVTVYRGVVARKFPLVAGGTLSLKCTDLPENEKYAEFSYIYNVFDSLVIETYVKLPVDTVTIYDTVYSTKNFMNPLEWTFQKDGKHHGTYKLIVDPTDFP
jgi:hypothetical protein